MVDFIDFVLEIFLEIKYWIKHRKQRKYEKENKLPKRIVWYPYAKQFAVLYVIFGLVILSSAFLYFKGKNKEKTTKRMIEISILLESEKKQFGKYPLKLKNIIRNNPLRKNITVDYWKSAFVYTISEDGKNYQLISLGSDGKLNTKDDILCASK